MNQCDGSVKRWLILLALKVEDGAMSPGMWVTSGSWKRQRESGVSLRVSRGEHSPNCSHLDVGPLRSISDFLPLEGSDKNGVVLRGYVYGNL